jgi:hypothetical protein
MIMEIKIIGNEAKSLCLKESNKSESNIKESFGHED